MKKRIFSLFVCAALLMCSAVGCSKEEGSAGDGSAAKYQTMEPPEDGWTVEELLSVTYLCDTQLSYPLTLESLGEDFSVDETYSFESDYGVSTYLLYKGQMLTAIGYSSINKLSDFSESLPIDLFSINQTVKHENAIVLNGISLGTSSEEVKIAMGEPYESDEDNQVLQYSFKEDENIELILTFESDELYSVRFSCINGKD